MTPILVPECLLLGSLEASLDLILALTFELGEILKFGTL